MEKALNSGKVFKVLRKNLARGVRVSEICDVENVRDAVLPAEKKASNTFVGKQFYKNDSVSSYYIYLIEKQW